MCLRSMDPTTGTSEVAKVCMLMMKQACNNSLSSSKVGYYVVSLIEFALIV